MLALRNINLNRYGRNLSRHRHRIRRRIQMHTENSLIPWKWRDKYVEKIVVIHCQTRKNIAQLQGSSPDNQNIRPYIVCESIMLIGRDYQVFKDEL